MAEPLVNAQTPLEFFEERVEAACDRQRLTATLTSYYWPNSRVWATPDFFRQPSTSTSGRGL